MPDVHLEIPKQLRATYAESISMRSNVIPLLGNATTSYSAHGAALMSLITRVTAQRIKAHA